MSFTDSVAVLKNYISDLEVELKKIEDRGIKSSGAKSRLLLQKVKLESNQLRKDVLTKVKSIPTKTRKKNVEISEVEEIIPMISPMSKTSRDLAPLESSSDEAPKKKARGRPKKATA